MRRDVLIRQHDRQDCAAACLCSVLAHYGLRLPLIACREACGTDEEGASLQGIADAFRKFGVEAVALKSRNGQIAEVQRLGFPLILHLKKEDGWLHFVVLYGLTETRARLMDPETGKISDWKTGDLERRWTGYLLKGRPGASFRSGDRRARILPKLFRLLRPSRRRLAGAMFASTFYIAATLSTSVFIQLIIDEVLPNRNVPVLMILGVSMCGLALLSALFSYLRSVLLVKAGLHTDRLLISAYFRKLFTLPVSFFDSRSSGELNARVSDAYRIRNFVTGRLLLLTTGILILLLSTGILFRFNARLATLTVAFIPFYLLICLFSDRINRKLNRQVIGESAKMEALNIESISVIRAVRYFGAEEFMSGRVTAQYEKSAEALRKGGMMNALFSSLSETVTRSMTVVILIGGSFLIFDAQLTPGELVSFFAIAGYFSTPVEWIVESSRNLSEARIACERLFDIIDFSDRERKAPRGRIPEGRNDLRIEGLSFSFPGRKRLIEGLDCTFRCGEITLITGENGSGKSTLASLLMQGYAPDSGRILLGDRDISEIPLHLWRRHIAIVPQQADIFNGTLLENITMEETGGNPEDIAAVCALSGLDRSLFRMPEGIMTRTGEQACRLSGGERQKIAFARALYRRPRIILLDEAMTHLDPETRSRFIETLVGMKRRGCIVLIISHEESARDCADKILRLKDNTCTAQQEVMPHT